VTLSDDNKILIGRVVSSEISSEKFPLENFCTFIPVSIFSGNFWKIAGTILV